MVLAVIDNDCVQL